MFSPELQIGEIRQHPEFGKVQLVPNDAPTAELIERGMDLVAFVPMDDPEDLWSTTRAEWSALPLWPELDHLPEGDGRNMDRRCRE